MAKLKHIIFIKMFFDDHAPLHFHAEYAEFKEVIDIQNLAVIHGRLPHRAQELVLDWAALHRQELLDDWKFCADRQQPKPIRPLR